MRDLVDNIKMKPMIAPMYLEKNLVTVPLCTKGYDSLTLSLNVGQNLKWLSDDNCVQFLLEHGKSKDELTPVLDEHLLGGDPVKGGVFLTLNNPKQGGSIYCFGYIGDHPYVRLKVIKQGEHEYGMPMSCAAILGHGQNMPPESYLERLDEIEAYL